MPSGNPWSAAIVLDWKPNQKHDANEPSNKSSKRMVDRSSTPEHLIIPHQPKWRERLAWNCLIIYRNLTPHPTQKEQHRNSFWPTTEDLAKQLLLCWVTAYPLEKATKDLKNQPIGHMAPQIKRPSRSQTAVINNLSSSSYGLRVKNA